MLTIQSKLPGIRETQNLFSTESRARGGFPSLDDFFQLAVTLVLWTWEMIIFDHEDKFLLQKDKKSFPLLTVTPMNSNVNCNCSAPCNFPKSFQAGKRCSNWWLRPLRTCAAGRRRGDRNVSCLFRYLIASMAVNAKWSYLFIGQVEEGLLCCHSYHTFVLEFWIKIYCSWWELFCNFCLILVPAIDNSAEGSLCLFQIA